MDQRMAPRTRTRLAPDVRRALVLDAATRVILRQGAARMTMEDVAHEAGVARGTVYLYFDSVDDVLAALRERHAQAFVEEVGRLLPVGGSGSRLRRLDGFIAAMAASFQGGHELHHALFEGAGASEAPLVEAFRPLLRRFIEDGRDAGEFAVPDLDVTTGFLVAGLHAALREGPHKGNKAKVISAAQKLARRTLRPSG